MSTSALLDNPVLENDQQSVPPPPTRHCRDDLSRAFGVAAYEWSESDQDAIDRRTTNAFLQNNRLNVPQMNPLEGTQEAYVSYSLSGKVNSLAQCSHTRS